MTTKTTLILRIGKEARRLNPEIEITSNEIEQLRKKTILQLTKFLEELKRT